MKLLPQKLKPASGLASLAHAAFVILQPIIILILIRLGFDLFAVSIVLLAKWRIFAVRPRHWLSNIRANMVDVFVGLSVVIFMAGTESMATQLVWTILYVTWLLILKPRSDLLSVMLQALIAQGITMVAFYEAFPDFEIITLIAASWLICYASSRHFFGAFEEDHAKQAVYLWAWFGACLAWVLSHWSIEYLFVPQMALILSVVGYGLAAVYYLYKTHRLHDNIRAQLVGITFVLVLIIIFFSDWKDKTL